MIVAPFALLLLDASEVFPNPSVRIYRIM